MTAVIQADSFIETGSCDGPRYNRNAPSRENPGVLMSDIQDKYITEFELPYRNIERYIKEIGNNWDRLDNKQKSMIKLSFQNMGLSNNLAKEKFGDTGTNSNSPNTNITNFITYLAANSSNTQTFMNTLWNTPPDQTSQLGVTNDQLSQIKDSMYQWSVDNSYVLHSNWRSGTILFFFLLIIIILIIIAATSGK